MAESRSTDIVAIGEIVQAAQIVSPKSRRWVAGKILRRNKLALLGLIYLLVIGGLIVTESLLDFPSATFIDLTKRFSPPSSEHWLGTDENGRDVLVRLIRGGRISLAVGVSGATLTAALGGIMGLVSGYFGGAVDHVLMRFTDGLMSIPVFFIVLTIVAIFQVSVISLVLILALTNWMGVARLVRSEILRHKNLEFIIAAESAGATNMRIMVRHLLPQAIPSLIVATSIAVGSMMLAEAGLSFLGLGISPPTPSWGNMLSNSQYYIWSAPHLAIYPGLMILFSVLAFNSLGDVVRDILDPRRKALD